MENPIKMDDLGVHLWKPPLLENPLPSLRRLAKSAPDIPGVCRAMADRSTPGAKFLSSKRCIGLDELRAQNN